MSSNERYLRTASAAVFCGSTKSTFEKLRVSGGGPPFIKYGRTVVYDVVDLTAWLSARRKTSTSDISSHDGKELGHAR